MSDRRDSNAASRREIAEWLVQTGFPFDWDVETTPPTWLLDELAAAWHRRDKAHDETVEDYRAMLICESMAWKGLRDVAA